DHEGAGVAYRALLPHAGLHLAGGAGVIVTRGSVERVLGVTAGACGRLDAAVAHLRRAVEANERSGLPPCVAEAGCELAELLVVRDGPGDRAGAARAAARAAAIAERLGMRPVAARCQAVDRELGDGGGPLSPREREIAGLVARGLTNRQIAVQLHIGHRTAENHVQHILTKLGFNTRSQVAAWVTANRPSG
ncbi:MAG: helix-turn-helix transcriptional regulator, partial [Acidimicrobiia bacterium]